MKSRIIQTHCVNCGKKFVAERSTAKYCSNRCKMDYRNNKKRSELDRQFDELEQSLKSLRQMFEKNPTWCAYETYERLSELRKLLDLADNAQLAGSQELYRSPELKK